MIIFLSILSYSNPWMSNFNNLSIRSQNFYSEFLFLQSTVLP